jgi:DNA-binding NarL/FixJ family response regulator
MQARSSGVPRVRVLGCDGRKVSATLFGHPQHSSLRNERGRSVATASNVWIQHPSRVRLGPTELDGDCLTPSSISVLVVDDFEPFRQFLSSSLRNTSNGFVCWEASDGLEAVHKAEELQPDLILLDIGLPKLNGIRAARQIAKVSPGSKILFVSQESSADVVQEAFRAGGLGYIVKTDAVCQLLTAVNAVLRGGSFVGSRFDGHEFTGASHVRVSDGARQKMQSARRHEAQFYSDDEGFLESFTRFIDSALRAGNAVIVLATESHRNKLLLRLQGRGLDVAAAIEQGRYVSLEAAGTLATVMVNDRLDRPRFLKLTGEIVAKAARAVKGENGRVAACGECASLLWAQGNAEAAVLLEHLWDEFAQLHGLDVLCGYVLNSFQREQENSIYERICAEHSAVSSQ